MKYAYYPGCSSSGTGKAFEKSSQYVAKQIGMELVEIPDWNCCGATAAHTTNHDLAMALPARNLALAEDMDMDVATTCAACFSRLKTAVHFARESEENKQKLEEILGMPYNAKNDVYSMLDILSRPEQAELIKQNISKSLNGLKVACYYGCLLVRPRNVCKFDDTENPQSMDKLMKAAGAEPVDWAFKTECCGASAQVNQPKLGREMIDKILRNAQANGAEAIATACPLCMLNLDMREKELNKTRGRDYDMPVYFFTELLAMAMGANAKEIAMDTHFVPAEALVQDAFERPEPVAAPKKKVKTPLEIASEKAEANRKAAGVDVIPETCEEPAEPKNKGGAE